MRSYKTLVVIDHYLPGRLAGGPITTISNLVNQLSEYLDVLIVTRNTDLDGRVYNGIEPWSIRRVGEADVLYIPPDDFTPQALERIGRFFLVEQIYFNSFFSPSTIFYLIQDHVYGLFRHSRPRILLAPRGEFSEGALRLKSLKKKAYIALFRLLHIEERISVFQASSALEEKDIKHTLGLVRTHIAPDIPASVQLMAPRTLENRKLVFISRISPMKNLIGALDILKCVKHPCQIDIYGPLEDTSYWQECEKRIAALPDHIIVNYKGNLAHDQVVDVLGTYSLFLFPTLGENFGHVIFEALAAGCPVLVSDQTPWQDLEEHDVGWIKPLVDQAGFVQVIEQVLQDPLNVRQERARRCMAYAKAVSEDQEVIAANLELFSKY